MEIKKLSSVSRYSEPLFSLPSLKSIKDIEIECSDFILLKCGRDSFLWGKLDKKVTIEKPYYLTKFEKYQIKFFSTFENFTFMNIGYFNSENVIFSNFDPPIIFSSNLESLVEFLFDRSFPHKFVQTFFATYPLFSDSNQILRMITEQYKIEQQKTKSTKELSVVKEQ